MVHYILPYNLCGRFSFFNLECSKLVPNEPSITGGIVSFVTFERLNQKLTEVFHLHFLDEIGCAFIPISTPWLRKSPAFTNLCVNPDEGGTVCQQKKVKDLLVVKSYFKIKLAFKNTKINTCFKFCLSFWFYIRITSLYIHN